MNCKWSRVMVLLLLILLAAPAQASAMEGITVEIPFTVEYAPGTVVIEPLDGAPAPDIAEYAGAAEGKFEIAYAIPDNYHYKVYQRPGPNENIDYDATVFNVEVCVLVDEAWRMYAVVTVGVDGDPHKPDNVAFENIQRTGALCVKKTVIEGEEDRDWHFTITLSEKVNGFYGDIRFHDGVGHTALKHGGSVTMEGLPAGAKYEVAEDEANVDGYVTTAEHAKGTIGKDKTITAAFVNDGSEAEITPPQTGDTRQMRLWLCMGGISLLCILWILLSWRKRRAEE